MFSSNAPQLLETKRQQGKGTGGRRQAFQRREEVSKGEHSHEQLDEPAADVGLNDGLDLVVGSVGEVAQGPAGVREHLLVVGVHQTRQGRESLLGLFAQRGGEGGVASVNVVRSSPGQRV